MSYTPFNHVPRDAQPSPPPTALRLQGRAFSTYRPDLLRATADRWPEHWATVEATVAEHCPGATVTDWLPSGGYDLGIWRVHVRSRVHEQHMQRIRAIRRALGPLCVVVEVVG